MQIGRSDKLPSRILVAGPTGSGKTTLATQLARSLGAVCLSEPIHSWQLAAVDSCPKKLMADFQRRQMLRRLQMARRIGDLPFVCDRSPLEDRSVFIRLHHEAGFITAGERQILCDLSSYVGNRIGRFTKCVFLTTDFRTLVKRTKDHPRFIRERLIWQRLYYRNVVNALCRLAPTLELRTDFLTPHQTFNAAISWLTVSGEHA